MMTAASAASRARGRAVLGSPSRAPVTARAAPRSSRALRSRRQRPSLAPGNATTCCPRWWTRRSVPRHCTMPMMKTTARAHRDQHRGEERRAVARASPRGSRRGSASRRLRRRRERRRRVPPTTTSSLSAIARGNLCWLAAFEAEPATYSMALRVYPKGQNHRGSRAGAPARLVHEGRQVYREPLPAGGRPGNVMRPSGAPSG